MLTNAQAQVAVLLSQSKKLERDARTIKQGLAALQDDLQGRSPQGATNGSSNEDPDA